MSNTFAITPPREKDALTPLCFSCLCCTYVWNRWRCI